MTYNIAINQLKMMEWDLSFKACAILHKMVDLSSWADAIHVEKKTYYVLYRNKMLEELPCLGAALSTVSKYIQELEQKKIIESINKSTVPAYRLTAKGREWISDSKNENSNNLYNANDIINAKINSIASLFGITFNIDGTVNLEAYTEHTHNYTDTTITDTTDGTGTEQTTNKVTTGVVK